MCHSFFSLQVLVCDASLKFILGFCNPSVYCVVQIDGGTLKLFSSFSEFSTFVSGQVSAQQTPRCVLVDLTENCGKFVRHCGRLRTTPLQLIGSEIHPIEIPPRKRACSDAISEFQFAVVEVARDTPIRMAPIVFNFAVSRRGAPSVFENDFYFVGSASKNGLLEVLVIGLLSDCMTESFYSFIEMVSVSDIMNSEEPFFIGFFLHTKCVQSIAVHKNLLCSFAPVVIYLSQIRSGEQNVAEWNITRNDSTPVRFATQQQGFVVHSNDSKVTACASYGFDVFFKQGKHSVAAVDTKTLKEITVSRRYGTFMDTVSSEKVPLLETLMRQIDLKKEFPGLSCHNLILTQKQGIFTYIDAQKFCVVPTIALLEHRDIQKLPAKHKTGYLSILTFMFSRTGLLQAEWHSSQSFFAAIANKPFMLNQLADVRAQHVAADLKSFYDAKSGEVGAPGHDFLDGLIRSHVCTLKLAKPDVTHAYEAYSFPKGFPKSPPILNAQLYSLDHLSFLRSSMDVFPTIEFHMSSCWIEAAVNSIVSIPLARYRMQSVPEHSVGSCFRSLIDTMCIYGTVYQNQVPVLDCMRCGVYPLLGHEHVAPRILGGSYGCIFLREDDKVHRWGTIGSSIDAFIMFLSELSIVTNFTGYDPSDDFNQSYSDAIVTSGFKTDVLIVDFHPDRQPHPTQEIVEKSINGCCVAVVFGNLAHNFSVTKSEKGIWTVKDALVDEFKSYTTFIQALARARDLHTDSYFVQYAVYIKTSS